LALTAGGAMRAEDDRRVRQTSAYTTSSSFVPHLGDKTSEIPRGARRQTDAAGRAPVERRQRHPELFGHARSAGVALIPLRGGEMADAADLSR